MKIFTLILCFLAMPVGLNAAVQQPGIAVGQIAPDFEAVNHLGEIFYLSEALTEGPVVLIFYRGGWCPYCNTQLQAYQKHMDRFRELGATIVALSVDKPEKGSETVSENSLDFAIISNPDANVLRMYGLTFQIPMKLAIQYKDEYKIDLEGASGRTDAVIALPATFVLDKDRRVVFGRVNADYKVRVPPEEVLQVLTELQSLE